MVATAPTTGSGSEVDVIYATTAEAQNYLTSLQCGSQLLTGSITVNNLAAGEEANVGLGWNSSAAIGPGSKTFTTQAPAATADLLGVLSTRPAAVSKMILRHGVTVSAVAPLDFTRTEAFAPVTPSLTITGTGSNQVCSRVVSHGQHLPERDCLLQLVAPRFRPATGPCQRPNRPPATCTIYLRRSPSRRSAACNRSARFPPGGTIRWRGRSISMHSRRRRRSPARRHRRTRGCGCSGRCQRSQVFPDVLLQHRQQRRRGDAHRDRCLSRHRRRGRYVSRCQRARGWHNSWMPAGGVPTTWGFSDFTWTGDSASAGASHRRTAW